MTTLYVSPTGSGTQDGSSVANAGTLTNISSLIGAAGPGGQVLLIADQGDYTLGGAAIIVASGGADGRPVTVRGVDSAGDPMRASIVGTRPDPFDPAGFVGEQVFRLVNGADNLSFSDMSFTNIGYGAFRVGGDIRNLTIEHVDATNVQRFFEDYVTGTNTTATISGLTIRDADIDGYSRGAIRLGYNTNNVLIEDVHGDSQRQDESGSTFAIGVHIEGSAHDIVIRNSSMRNAEDRLSGSFWNGDGFATEGGAYNIRFENTVASGNVDAGYDIKSKSTVLVNAVSEDNGRNFRVWSNDLVLTNITSVDPNLRGGNSSQNDVWFNRGAKATLVNPVFSDLTSNTAVSLTEGSATANVTNLVALIGPNVALYRLLSKSVFTVDKVDYGAAVTSGVSYANSAVGVAVYAGDSTGHMIVGSAFDDVIRGGAGNDVLVGGSGNDRLIGGDGDDIFVGGAGADVLLGQGGFDIVDYSAAAGAVRVDLGGSAPGGAAAGDLLDGIEGLIGSAFDDLLIGDGAANLLVGGAGDDILDGGKGDDVLVGGTGADTLIGGAGIDAADYSASDAAVTVDLSTGTGLGGHAEGDRLRGIEVLVGSAFADTLIGGAGGTRFIGGAGADLLVGGAGIDTADYGANTQGVVIDLAAGTSTGGDAEGDRLVAIEVVRGSAFADTIRGDGLANTLIGGAGDDTFDGAGGDDRLIGGAGADTLTGGDGFDTVDYAANAVGVSVDLAAGTASGGDADGDRLSGIEHVVGTAFSDSLTGDAGDNVLDGGDGDDLLVGGAGADRLNGGLGNDRVSYAGALGGVTLDLRAGTGAGDAAGDVLQDIEIVIGSAFDDTLVAAGTVRTLIGNAGNDRLTGGDGDDLLIGGAGADAINGGAGIDTIDYSGSETGVIVNLDLGLGFNGDAEGDTIANVERVVGSRFADLLVGTGRGGILIGGSGADMLIGGIGFDTADYSASATAVTVSLAGGTGQGGDAEGDILSGIRGLTGSAFADRLTGDDTDNVFAGGLGADVLTGGGGNDTASYADSLVGVTASLATGTASDGDTLIGIENLAGSAFNDVLTGDDNANILTGGDGNDTLDGGAGDDLLIGGLGGDSYTVDSAGDVVVELVDGGNDRVNTTLSSYTLGANVENLGYIGTGSFTGYGNDLGNTLNGSTGSEIWYGYDGDDKFQGSLGADIFYGGAGRNSADYSKSRTAITVNLTTNVNLGGDADGDLLYDVTLLSGSNFGDSLTGADTADTLYGRGGVDILYGLGGNDKLDGGAGADVMVGGAGDDLYIVDDANDQVIEDVDGGYDTISLTLDYWTLADNVEAVVTSTVRVFTGIGNAGDNSITGNSNADWLYGLSGNDILTGEGGADHLFGGEGSDTAAYATSLVGVRVNLLTGEVKGGDAEGDVLDSIENLIGSAKADALTGDNGDNRLTGGNGDDVLTGNGGNDVLDGGAGADTMVGGTDDDIYLADSVDDRLFEDGDAGIDTVRAATSAWTLGANFENLIATGSSAFTGTGNELDNSLWGRGGDDTLYGLAGNDRLDGGLGADTMVGGTGDDTYYVDDAGDRVIEDADAGLDTVRTSLAAYTLGANVENLVAAGAAIDGTGNDGDNILVGTAGDDVLHGLAGTDTLDGGAGADQLFGGAGIDTVTYARSVAGVTVDLAGGGGSGGDAQGDRLDQIENLIGSAFADRLTGDASANILSGGGGDDRLYGGGGNDLLIGGAGNDLIDGGAGTDVLQLSGARSDYAFSFQDGTVAVRDLRAGMPDGIDTFGGIEQIQYLGGMVKPVAAIEGTIGVDTLTGTAAADVFLYDTAQGLQLGNDAIRNFGAGDRIVTTSAIAGANASGRISVNASDRYILAGANSGDASQSTGGIKLYSANGKLVSSIQLLATETHGGVTYYSYGAAGDTMASGRLNFGDATPPTVGIAFSAASLGDAVASGAVTFSFSKASTGFTAEDIGVTHGTIANLQAVAGNPLAYTATFTAAVGYEGQAAITVAAGSFTDSGGLANTGASVSFAIDTLNPTLAITSSSAALTTGQTATLTFVFSEATTGFTRESIGMDSGTLGQLVAGADGRSYTVTYTPGADVHGVVAIHVAGSTYHDAAGNAGVAASTSLSVDTAPSQSHSYNGTAGADSFTAATADSWTINGFGGNDVLAGASGADVISGGEGNDRVTGNGGNDLIDGGAGVDTIVLNGARSDYAIGIYNGSLAFRDLRAGTPDGTDTVTSVEQAQFLGGGNKPIGVIEGTWVNDTLTGTDAADIFLFDTALGLALGSDQIRNFNTGDRFVTTSRIYDDNNDGKIRANASDRFMLAGTVDGAASETTGQLKLLNANGKAIANIVLESTVADHGITYYVYAAAGDTAPHASLHF